MICSVVRLDKIQLLIQNHSIRRLEGPFHTNVQIHHLNLVRLRSNWYSLLDSNIRTNHQSRHPLVIHQRYQARDPSLIVYQQDWSRIHFVHDFLELEGEHMNYRLYREHGLQKYYEAHRESCSKHARNWCLESGSQMVADTFVRMLDLFMVFNILQKSLIIGDLII